MVLTNPPFGKKSCDDDRQRRGRGRAGETSSSSRDDFWATTSNKQLNFVQHVKTLLKIGGRRGGRAGQRAVRGRRRRDGPPEAARTSATCTRCCACRPAIFYAQGVKANVIFFDRKPASEAAATRELWVYDLRTNQHFTLKQNPLRYEHLDDFVACFAAREETERFKRFTYERAARARQGHPRHRLAARRVARGPREPPAAGRHRAEIVEDLEAALAEFSAVAESLGEPAES